MRRKPFPPRFHSPNFLLSEDKCGIFITSLLFEGEKKVIGLMGTSRLLSGLKARWPVLCFFFLSNNSLIRGTRVFFSFSINESK